MLEAAHVALRRGAGEAAGRVRALPFGDAPLEAGRTVSTLLHVTDAELDRAPAEIGRVLQPGASRR